jgi:hypothetical protein
MAPILSRLAVEVNEKPRRHGAACAALCPLLPGSLRSRHYLFQAGIYEVPLDEDSVLLLRALPDSIPAWGVGTTDASLSGGMAEAAGATQVFADSHRNL